jgi:predicted AAA+ superfamily ATPase
MVQPFETGSVPADPTLLQILERIAVALERLAPRTARDNDLRAADAFVWHAESRWLEPVHRVSSVDMDLLLGIERNRDNLLQNSLRFAHGLPANNALLWGARGTGKSSLVKAVHGRVCEEHPGALALVEIHREDIASLPDLLALLRQSPRRVLLFCDDLSFEAADSSYKSLKALLEGGLEGRPENVLFYATSNRRHILARDLSENEQASAVHAGDSVEEKVSLSDRFGLWLGFHNLDQETFFRIVEAYAERFALNVETENLRAQAREWSVTRGSRSGRVAWQFIQDLAGRLGRRLDGQPRG